MKPSRQAVCSAALPTLLAAPQTSIPWRGPALNVASQGMPIEYQPAQAVCTAMGSRAASGKEISSGKGTVLAEGTRTFFWKAPWFGLPRLEKQGAKAATRVPGWGAVDGTDEPVDRTVPAMSLPTTAG